MVSSAEILAAFREVSNTKQLDRAELYALLQDGILAALAKKYGPNVQAEVDIDDGKGDIRIVPPQDRRRTGRRLEQPESPSTTPSRSTTASSRRRHGRADRLRRLRRAAVQAAKQRIIQRVREGERTPHPRRVRDAASATSSPARFSRSSAESSSSCSTSSAKRKPSFRTASRTIGSTSTRASRFARC
jgi:hypothetical protein